MKKGLKNTGLRKRGLCLWEVIIMPSHRHPFILPLLCLIEEKGVKINFEHTYVSLSSCSLGMIQFALPLTAGVNSPL